MIVDTSALVTIFLEEPGFRRFAELIERSLSCRISVVNLVELCMVMESRIGSTATARIDAFLFRASVTVEPVVYEHALLARRAFLDFGKGRHPARLNFGDCFAYALAKATGEPLLFRGDDFHKTDIVPAF